MRNKRWLILIIVGFLLIPVNVWVPDASADPVVNNFPVLSNPVPENNADIDIYFNESYPFDMYPYLSINCTDDDGDSMVVDWYSNSSGSWIKFAQNTSVLNETVTQGLVNWSTFGIWYWWSVNVTDGYNWTNATYRFMISASAAPAGEGDDEGWLIASLPVNETVSKYDVRIINATQNYSWVEAVDNTIILAFVYGWDEEYQYYVPSDYFVPYQGYWIYLYDLNYSLWVNAASGGVGGDDVYVMTNGNGNGLAYSMVFGAMFLMLGLFIPYRRRKQNNK